ncbi:hypothetical protein STENM327S_03973 [Streptomyces tendae]
MLRDPATWRDVLWLPVDMTAGFVSALLAFALALYPLEAPRHRGRAVAGAARRVLVRLRQGHRPDLRPLRRRSEAPCSCSPPTGSPRSCCAPTSGSPARSSARCQGELAERVRVLTETRRDAVDTSAAELRRIERDLHDGAQARLVAVGMDLGTIEALLEKDPAKARELLARTRQSSADALTELRELVRGIHPPVLAERGLGDAVRALALRLPVTVEVEVDLPGRAEAPVEAAAYFAVSEILTNAVKHSGADRIWVERCASTDGTQEFDAGDQGGGAEGNIGKILQAPPRPRSSSSAAGRASVVAMPKFLRVITGDAKSFTNARRERQAPRGAAPASRTAR